MCVMCVYFFGRSKKIPYPKRRMYIFTVNTANANKINIIIDGVATEYEGNSASVSVPNNATYVRAEGHSDDDIVFTNPIILKEYVPKPDSITKTILLFMS